MPKKAKKAKGQKHKRPYRAKAQEAPLVGSFVLSATGDKPQLICEQERFKVAAHAQMGAMHGDIVACSWHKSSSARHRASKEKMVRVRQILKRNTQELVGRFESDGALNVLVSLDPRIPHDFFIEPTDSSIKHLGLSDGDIVRGKITVYPTAQSFGLCTVVERLDKLDAQRLAQEQLKAKYNLNASFSQTIEKALQGLKTPAEEFSSVLAAKDGQKCGQKHGYDYGCELERKDLRDLETITIDPLDARDFDDALSCKVLPDKSYKLWVHIADVSHYVWPQTALDKEAKKRACSVYLADGVIPMLPERLSCDLCSLKPYEERFAFTVELHLSAEAQILSKKFYPSIICSDERYTYDEVYRLLLNTDENGPDQELVKEKLQAHQELLLNLHKLAQKREALGRKRGELFFSSRELKLYCDDEGKVYDICLKEPNEATKLVEECMIAANVAVAQYLSERSVQASYRVHDEPDPKRLEELQAFLLENFPDDKELIAALSCGDPYALQEILLKSKGTENEYAISYLLLRAMKKAQYEAINRGHFGLALEHYCHFTSPIRRYPDLIVHRALKAALGSTAYQEAYLADQAELHQLALHCSEMERAAEQASQESVKLKLAEYMQEQKGKTFKARIYRIEAYGLFVELVDSMVKGLVPRNLLQMSLVQAQRKQAQHEGAQHKQAQYEKVQHKHVQHEKAAELKLNHLGIQDWDLELFYNQRRNELELVGTNFAFKLGQELMVEVYQVDLSRAYIDFKPNCDDLCF